MTYRAVRLDVVLQVEVPVHATGPAGDPRGVPRVPHLLAVLLWGDEGKGG